MVKHKITKLVEANLKKIAAQLDEMYGPEFDVRPTRQAIAVTMEEARGMNLELPDGLPKEKIEEKGMMMLNRVQYETTAVNRYRRLRTAYEKGGNQAVNDWLGPYRKGPGYENQRAALAKRLAAADPTRRVMPESTPKKKTWFGKLIDKVRDLSMPTEL